MEQMLQWAHAGHIRFWSMENVSLRKKHCSVYRVYKMARNSLQFLCRQFIFFSMESHKKFTNCRYDIVIT